MTVDLFRDSCIIEFICWHWNRIHVNAEVRRKSRMRLMGSFKSYPLNSFLYWLHIIQVYKMIHMKPKLHRNVRQITTI